MHQCSKWNEKKTRSLWWDVCIINTKNFGKKWLKTTHERRKDLESRAFLVSQEKDILCHFPHCRHRGKLPPHNNRNSNTEGHGYKHRGTPFPFPHSLFFHCLFFSLFALPLSSPPPSIFTYCIIITTLSILSIPNSGSLAKSCRRLKVPQIRDVITI